MVGRIRKASFFPCTDRRPTPSRKGRDREAATNERASLRLPTGIPNRNLPYTALRRTDKYDLIWCDRHSDSPRAPGDSKDFTAVLKPNRPGYHHKFLSADAAGLLHSLDNARSLPPLEPGDAAEAQWASKLAALVLDGVLEITEKSKAITGPDALSFVIARSLQVLSRPHYLLRLSVSALVYAQSLELEDLQAISSRLYCYNRYPLNAEFGKTLSSQAIEAELCRGFGCRANEFISRYWRPVALPADAGSWKMWARRADPARGRADGGTYKLYISPAPDCFVDTALTVLTQVGRMGTAFSLKMGTDPWGVLRPDKMVAYFRSFKDLRSTARVLGRELRGVQSHGVPFTAPMHPSGLLSWGFDPPYTARHLHTQHESWRLWICTRLASSLVQAKLANVQTMEPWEYAILRLQLDGVDTVSWSLKDDAWSQ